MVSARDEVRDAVGRVQAEPARRRHREVVVDRDHHVVVRPRVAQLGPAQAEDLAGDRELEAADRVGQQRGNHVRSGHGTNDALAGTPLSRSFLPLVATSPPPHDAAMVIASCPRHGTKVLLGAEAIERIDNHADGLTVHYRCTCGARWSERTGRRRTTAIT